MALKQVTERSALELGNVRFAEEGLKDVGGHDKRTIPSHDGPMRGKFFRMSSFDFF